MGERTRVVVPEEMATTSTAVATVSSQLQEEPVERVAVITLRPGRTQPRKKVVWTEDTVDNENMNKKKSKCCCIYEKPHKFGESDSDDSDDECEHCFGHVERRRTKHQKQNDSPTTVTEEAPAAEPTVSTTLYSNDPTPAAPPDKVENNH